MGWRSWNFFKGAIDDSTMRGQIDAMVKPRPVPSAGGKAMSLLDLGYTRAGIDDGWQMCDSYRVMPSNSSAFHDAQGAPIVNESKFPDLRALTDYATSKRVLLGWYENNCICHESGGHIRNQTWRNLSYYGDVQQLVQNNFSGIKIDNCGLHNDMDLYAALMNATGRAFMVERSDQGKGTPTNDSWCPYNMFRSSGDIRPSWSSINHNLHTVLGYTNISRPGCWAYPDMLQSGNLQGPLAAVESRSHFGAWCIVSSPLILGVDLADEAVIGKMWPYISNVHAIAVNQQWSGDPGRLLLTTNTLELWAKRLPGGAMALLALDQCSGGSCSRTGLRIDLVKDAGMPLCADGKCSVLNIWGTAHAVHASAQLTLGPIGQHDSAFCVVSPPAV